MHNEDSLWSAWYITQRVAYSTSMAWQSRGLGLQNQLEIIVNPRYTTYLLRLYFVNN